MKLQAKIAVLTGVLALGVSSAALAVGPPEGVPPNGANANGKGPTYTPADPTPGPKAGLPAKAKAYGRYCKGKSKQHVKGEQGTEFSRCVTTMARAANNPNTPPGRICKGKSKKHVKGERGTEFSSCVKAVAQLRKDQSEEGV
jgi:hypothetical protein